MRMRLGICSRVAVAVAAVLVVAVGVPVDAASAAPTFTIGGTVHLAAGAPVEWLQGVEVTLTLPGGSFVQEASPDAATGAYTFDGVAAGEYRIRFNGVPYRDDATGVINTPNLITEYSGDAINLAGSTPVVVSSSDLTGIDATLEIGNTISGHVDVPSGTPAAMLGAVTVWAKSTQYQLNSDPSAKVDPVTGNFTLLGLVPGSYRLLFSPVVYWDAGLATYIPSTLVAEYYNNSSSLQGSTVVTVGPANLTGLSVALDSGKSISGRVSLPSGSPVEWLNAITVAALKDGIYRTGLLNKTTGDYEITGLAPGTYDVLFDVHSYAVGETGTIATPPLASEYYNDLAYDFQADGVVVGSRDVTNINVTLDADVDHQFTTTPTPVIVGTPKVGSVLSAQAGTWSPAPAKLLYQWYRDGNYIAGATSSNYTVAQADGGHQISVGVLGARVTYTSVREYSQPVTVPGMSFTSAPSPTIVGEPAFASKLVASPGSWQPSPDSFTYQWYRDGRVIPGSTSASYTVGPDDGQHQISVVVKGVKLGYTTVAKASARVQVPALKFATAPTPTISGDARVGQTLTVSAPGWVPPAHAMSAQWCKDGVPIPGAQSMDYTVTALDAGHQLSVVVTGSREGFASTPKASARVTVPLLEFSTTPSPTITGTLNVGNKALVSLGAWTPKPDSVTYQWFRDGVAVPGATTYGYWLKSADAGHQLSVMVTAKKSGFRTVMVASKRFAVSN